MQLLGDVLSPPRCVACELAVRRAHVFCPACAATVERCGAADADIASDGVAFAYYGGALATAIRRLKYEDRPYLARPLGQLLRAACRAAELDVSAVLPVPLHPHRLVERGYNQAALLAAHVAREIGVPLVTTALVRPVDTAPQAKLSGAARQANLVTAIEVTGRAAVKDQVLAVVDDVSTTGATLGACGRALLAAGARRVVGVVLARTASSAQRIAPGLDAGAVLDIGDSQVQVSSRCANVPLRANLRN
ncbi:MAG TPA: ComF family protein [Polyangiaceae bacterium]|nr:ComF family protein [Polyangiaceae bacterium]